MKGIIREQFTLFPVNEIFSMLSLFAALFINVVNFYITL